MAYYVYIIISDNKKKPISYVGYTKNLDKRIQLHNSGRGAKFTRGRKWRLIYKKEYLTRNKAMVEEYKLKNNIKFRKEIKKKFNENIDTTSI